MANLHLVKVLSMRGPNERQLRDNIISKHRETCSLSYIYSFLMTYEGGNPEPGVVGSDTELSKTAELHPSLQKPFTGLTASFSA